MWSWKLIEIKEDIEDKQEKSYKKEKKNYGKANYTAMKKFCVPIL